jgi:heat shock protein HtpX
MARRRELFPADRGLQARMVLAAVLTPLLVLVVVAAVVDLAPQRVAVVLGLVAAGGVGLAVKAHLEAARPRPVPVAEAPELHAVVERLCTAADLPKPVLVRDAERQPNSWVIAAPRRPAELHVTAGLLEALTPAELEGVIAHELAHLAHHDAAVMTVVGGPGAVLLEAGGPLLTRGFNLWFTPGVVVAVAIGWVAQLGTNALSRYRELAADAGAAALTGHPAVLASALRKVSGELDRIPARDLRAVAGRDAFHLLAVADDGGGPWYRHGGGATHPALARRIERLEAMERGLHAARLPDPAG